MVKFKCPTCGAVYQVLSPSATITCPHAKRPSVHNVPTVCLPVK